MLTNIISVIHLLICLFLVLVILLQQGKGADMGATFGGGGNTLFGASGADNILVRVTTFSAVLFMCTSVYLAISGRAPTKFESKLFPSGSPAAVAPNVNLIPENPPAPGEAGTAGSVEGKIVEEGTANAPAAPEANGAAAPIQNSAGAPGSPVTPAAQPAPAAAAGPAPAAGSTTSPASAPAGVK